MPFYHIRITSKSNQSQIEVELDRSKEELEQRFLRPYRIGDPIVIAGRTICPDDIDRVQVSVSDDDSAYINERLLEQDARRNVIRTVDQHGRLEPWILANEGSDITFHFIEGPPGYETARAVQPGQEQGPPPNTREVFVVHGRNGGARTAMFAFLRAIGLQPLEWSHAIQATGKTSPYIGEILDAAFTRAHAVVVLLTPDDEARLSEPFRSPGDPPHETELTGQARPNVLFEAGMAMGRSQDRTVLVELGNLRPFSDIGGRHTIRFDGSSQRRQELAQRLEAAGCPVNLTGTDWHTAGDFHSTFLGLASSEEKPDGEENSREIG